MPKFTVYGGHDAYANYFCVVEAEDEASARKQAALNEQNWQPVGAISEFDDFLIHDEEGSVVPFVEGEHVPRTLYDLSPAERDIILAALRLWIDSVNDGSEYLNDMLIDIASNNGAHPMLDDKEIDALCERINV